MPQRPVVVVDAIMEDEPIEGDIFVTAENTGEDDIEEEDEAWVSSKIHCDHPPLGTDLIKHENGNEALHLYKVCLLIFT